MSNQRKVRKDTATADKKLLKLMIEMRKRSNSGWILMTDLTTRDDGVINGRLSNQFNVGANYSPENFKEAGFLKVRGEKNKREYMWVYIGELDLSCVYLLKKVVGLNDLKSKVQIAFKKRMLDSGWNENYENDLNQSTLENLFTVFKDRNFNYQNKIDNIEKTYLASVAEYERLKTIDEKPVSMTSSNGKTNGEQRFNVVVEEIHAMKVVLQSMKTELSESKKTNIDIVMAMSSVLEVGTSSKIRIRVKKILDSYFIEKK